MDLVSLKLIFAGVFFLSTFICLTIPICLFSTFKTRHKSHLSSSFQSCLSYLTCFGGGIFLGACLLDLFPEVIHHINQTIKIEFQYDNQALKRYPIAEFLIGCGLFFVLFIEQIVLSCRSISKRSIGQVTKRPTIILAHDDDDETSFMNPNEQDSSVTKHQFDISEQKDDYLTNQHRVLITRNFILILSLIIHSVFEGIALGATKDSKVYFELFFAIIIHKSIIAFSVGLKLMNLPTKRFVYLCCLGLSIATPIGILIVVTMQELLPDNRTVKIIHEILRAFACGTFFYITFFDVLPHELNISMHHHQQQSNSFNRCRLIKVVFVFLGFSSIGVLSFVMK